MIYYSITIKSKHWPKRIYKVKKIIKSILKNKKFFNLKKNIVYHLNFIFMNDSYIKKFNKMYKKSNIPTDVLTFVSNTKKESNICEKYCDIMFAAETLKKDAYRNKIDFYDHITHLITHCILHVAGFSHKKKTDYIIMKKKEIKILKSLGIRNPYI